MKRLVPMLMILSMMLAACGGGGEDVASGDGGGSTDDGAQEEAGSDSGGGGQVVDQQPAGQAVVAFGGQEFTLAQSPDLECAVTPDSINANFAAADNSIILGTFAERIGDDAWSGGILVQSEEADGNFTYSVQSIDASRVAIDGASMSYSGPMLRTPLSSSSDATPSEVDGTISLTCG